MDPPVCLAIAPSVSCLNALEHCFYQADYSLTKLFAPFQSEQTKTYFGAWGFAARQIPFWHLWAQILTWVEPFADESD